MSLPAMKRSVIAGPNARLREDGTASAVGVLTGVIFVFAGLVKCVFHHWELNAFHHFGLPDPSVLELTAASTADGAALAADASVTFSEGTTPFARTP